MSKRSRLPALLLNLQEKVRRPGVLRLDLVDINLHSVGLFPSRAILQPKLQFAIRSFYFRLIGELWEKRGDFP